MGGHCEQISISRECLHCHEVGAISQKMLDSGNEVDCITDHEGLQTVCLNLWVMQTDNFSYKKHESEVPDQIDCEYDEAN